MKPKPRVLKPTVWLLLGLSLFVTPAWSGIYTVEQLFMLPLEELMAVAVEMVIPPHI